MTDDHTLDDLTIVGDDEVPPEDLHTDGDNPNEQGDATFGHLVDGLRSGWVGGPIVVNTGDLPGYEGDAEGLICDGEHRWRAAKEAGRDTVPVRRVDFDDDAQRRYWRQHLNKVTGEHDTKRDALEYDHLLGEGYTDEVEALTDAADEDLDELLAELRVDNGVGPAYEYDPEHNVYFEDCVEGMRERLADDSVDMVFTSPPYNIEKGKGKKRTRKTVEYEDDRSESEFREFLRDVFEELDRVVHDDGHIFINIGKRYFDGDVEVNWWVKDLMPRNLRSFVVWDKLQASSKAMMVNQGAFYDSWEPIYHFSETRQALETTKAPDVWENDIVRGVTQESKDVGDHPAPFPVDLVKKAIEATTREGDRILDPFMGSGTTAVAAVETERDYVGFELDEEGAYKPIIERRIGEAKRQREAGVNQDGAADD